MILLQSNRCHAFLFDHRYCVKSLKARSWVPTDEYTITIDISIRLQTCETFWRVSYIDTRTCGVWTTTVYWRCIESESRRPFVVVVTHRCWNKFKNKIKIFRCFALIDFLLDELASNWFFFKSQIAVSLTSTVNIFIHIIYCEFNGDVIFFSVPYFWQTCLLMALYDKAVFKFVRFPLLHIERVSLKLFWMSDTHFRRYRLKL